MANTVIPDARMPIESLQQPATMPQMQEHGKHDTKDALDGAFRGDLAKEQQQLALANQRRMGGFKRIFLCPSCKRRIEPKDEHAIGKCPYCRSDVIPESKAKYAGEVHANSNKYSHVDVESFNAGRNLQCMQTTRRIVPVHNGPVKIER